LKERKKKQREGGRGTFEIRILRKYGEREREREWGREAGRSPRGQM
jgi:hypothetical protein